MAFALKLKIKLVSFKKPSENEHDLWQSWKLHKYSTKSTKIMVKIETFRYTFALKF